MRKVIVSNMVTLDGLFSGPNGEIDWHVVNDEFFRFAVEQLNAVDTLLFGRVTYEGMAQYWTSDQAMQDDPVITGYMNNLAKVVFTKTLKTADWKNSTLAQGDLADEIARLQMQPGKDMVIFGSGEITSSLTRLGLIDEYRIFVAPVILGSGKSMFAGLDHSIKLKLISTIPYTSGTVFLTYQPA